MDIISHRGYWWPDRTLQNTEKAFVKAAQMGFGIETDLRDHNKQLVISHDIPGKNAAKATDLFAAVAKHDIHLALNIKADGLHAYLQTILTDYPDQKYFVFDMSVPDMTSYLHMGFDVYTRQSDIEPQPVIINDIQGVWMDAFYDYSWITADRIKENISRGKKVCLVSPELHQMPYREFWALLKKDHNICDHVSICTDYPEEAKYYFGGNKND